MSLVAAKCTQCGANIEVDDTKEAGICQFCGTAFIMEKAISNYNTYITNNNSLAGATINIMKPEIDGLLESAKKELLIHNYSNANFYLDEIKKSGVDSGQKISQLFDELGILERTKTVWNNNNESKEAKELIKEITTYDSQNINVWLFMLETTLYPQDIIEYGNKVLALSSEQEKEYYKEIVYETYILKEFSPKKGYGLTNLVSEIPHDFIINNDKLQQLLMDKCSWFIRKHESIITSYEEQIDAWRKQLQSDKSNAIQGMLLNNRSHCYIATCVYGTYNCAEVWTLRRYRDYILDQSWYGRLFVKCYYAISPAIVKWFGETKWFKKIWKSILDRMVFKLNSKGVDDTYYRDKY